MSMDYNNLKFCYNQINMATVVEKAPVEGLPLREPRPGTKTAEMLPYLQEGKLGVDIAPLFNVSRANVGAVKSYAINSGYLSKPTDLEKEELRRAYGRHVSRVKGGVMLAVEPLVRMDMLSVEIMKALSLRSQNHFSYQQVDNAVGYLRRKDPTLRPNRTAEEWAWVNQQSKNKKETIEERVELWLAVRDYLMEYTSVDLPEKRNEWLFLIAYLNAKRWKEKRNNNLALPKSILKTLLENPLVTSRLKPYIEIMNKVTEPKTVREIDTGRFGTILTGREYAFSFYCTTHGREDEVITTLPHNIDPRKWAAFVDSETTVRGCNEKCHKRLRGIEVLDIPVRTST